MLRPLFLVRHAPVELDLAVPSAEWELNAEGRALAERLAALPMLADLQTVWSSPEPKAQATARPLAHRHGAALLIDPNLAELQRGPTNLPDRSSYKAAVRQAFAHPELSIGGWEPAQSAQQRIVSVVSRCIAAVTGPVAVVSHGLVLALLIAHLRGQPQVDLAAWQSIPLPAVAVMDRSTWQLLAPFQSVETWEIQPFINQQNT